MHTYRITVEELESNDSAGTRTGGGLRFTAENHDDLFHIVEVIRSKKLVDSDKSAALAIGLKLLSEVALEKRHDPLFSILFDSLRGFIQQLKMFPSEAR